MSHGRHPEFTRMRQRVNPIESVTEDVVAKVEGWRRQRMGWSAIGRNLGVSEQAARKRFDPDWKRPRG